MEAENQIVSASASGRIGSPPSDSNSKAVVKGHAHAAGLVLFRRGRGSGRPEYLLLQARWGRHWSFPKGHLEKDESLLSGALREVEEETGLGQDSIVLVGDFSEDVVYRLPRPTRNVPSGVKRVRMFLGLVPASARVKLSREHIKYRWLCKEAAMAMLSPEFSSCLIEAHKEALAH